MTSKQYPRMVPNPLHDPKNARSEAEIRVEDPAQHEDRSPLDYAIFTAEVPAVDGDEVSRAVNNAVLQERLRCANIAAKWPSAKAVAGEIASAIRKAPGKVTTNPVAKPASQPKAITAVAVDTEVDPAIDPETGEAVQQQLVAVGQE